MKKLILVFFYLSICQNVSAATFAPVTFTTLQVSNGRLLYTANGISKISFNVESCIVDTFTGSPLSKGMAVVVERPNSGESVALQTDQQGCIYFPDSILTNYNIAKSEHEKQAEGLTYSYVQFRSYKIFVGKHKSTQEIMVNPILVHELIFGLDVRVLDPKILTDIRNLKSGN